MSTNMEEKDVPQEDQVQNEDDVASSPKKARLDEAGNAAESALTEAERRKRRADRFGSVGGGADADDKKRKRAERFGVPTPQLEDEKKKKRSDRFGIVKEEEVLKTKLAERKQRFGISKDSDKKELRAQRFGTTKDEDKKKERAQRFASAAKEGSTTSGPHLTAKVNVNAAQRLGLPIRSNE
jgi:hypothetical protein